MAATLFQLRMAESLETTNCPDCGVEVWSVVLPERRNNGKSCYCINGHIFSWRETEESKLRKQLDAEKLRREQAERDAEWHSSVAKNACTQRTKAQNKLKKITTRINAGVCPHCNRTFKQLEAHMRCKHASEIVLQTSLKD